MATKNEYLEMLKQFPDYKKDYEKLTISEIAKLLKEKSEEKQRQHEERRSRAKFEFERGSAKITEVTASFSQTLQITQFQPSNFFCSMKAECNEEVDTKAIYEELKWQCKQNVFQALNELKAEHSKHNLK